MNKLLICLRGFCTPCKQKSELYNTHKANLIFTGLAFFYFMQDLILQSNFLIFVVTFTYIIEKNKKEIKREFKCQQELDLHLRQQVIFT